ncbi:MAG: ribosome-inactivating family protein [Bryobacteraceae bacterium]
MRGFADLKQSVRDRRQGSVIEIEARLAGNSVILFMEMQTLYLIGFRGRSGEAYWLKDDTEPYGEYIKKKTGVDPICSRIYAKYTGDTWKLVFRKAELNLASELAQYVPDVKPIDETKAHLDRLAFSIAEAARFIPIRCAVACELSGDYRFLQVIARLARWVETAGFKEMNAIPKEKPGEKLSAEHAALRKLHGNRAIQAMKVNPQPATQLTETGKWLDLLANLDKLSGAQRQRLASLDPNRYPPDAVTLGSFEALMKNWKQLSQLARSSPDMGGLLGELHLRNTAGATPAEETLVIPHYLNGLGL